MLAVSSAWAGPFSVTSVETSGTTFGTGTSSATAVERMRITQGGLVGISNTSPIAKLDVVGTISASDAIQVSGSSLTCASSINGALRWQSTSDTLQICTGSGWKSLASSTAAGTSLPGGGTNGQLLQTDGSGNYSWASVPGSMSSLAYKLIAYWPLDETAGNIAQDLSGNMLSAVNSGATVNQTGKVGGAYSFSGQNVTTGQTVYLNNKSFSIHLWAKRSSTGNTQYFGGLGTGSTNNGLHIGYRTATTLTIAFYTNDQDVTVANDTNWHAIGYTYDATTNERKIYYDGALVSTATASADFQGTSTFAIGTGGAAGGSFAGLLDEYAIWGRVLSLADFTTLYNGGSGVAINTSVVSGGGGATPAGSTADVQYNSAGALAADTGNFTYASGLLKAPTISATTQVQAPSVSLTTAGTTWGYLNSTGSFLPTISSNYVSASGVSVSGVVQVSGSSLTCASSINGAMRWSSTSDTLQICTGSGWKSLASSTTGGGGTLTGTGSATTVAYWSSASGLTYDSDGFYWDATNNRLGIGTNSPQQALDVVGFGEIGNYGADSGLLIRRANGTQGAPTVVANNNQIGNFAGLAYDGSAYQSAAWITISVDGTPGASDMPGRIVFWTTPDGSATPAERMRITQGGNVGISTSTPIAKLDVNGTISASDAIQVSGSSLTCSSAIKGAIRYSNTSSTIEFCQGAAWTDLRSSDIYSDDLTTGRTAMGTYTYGGGGAGGNAALIDNTATSAADPNGINASQYFGVDFGAGNPRHIRKMTVKTNTGSGYSYAVTYNFQWSDDNSAWTTVGTMTIPAGAGVTTTSYFPVSAAHRYWRAYYSSGTTSGNAWLEEIEMMELTSSSSSSGATPAGSTADVQFNSAGALAADSGLFTYSSGVLKAPTISATSHNGQYASLTTIYNPGSFSGNTIAANSISSTLVSASNISSTLIQVGPSSATCASSISGSIRYGTASNTLQICTGTGWVSLASGSTGGGGATPGGSDQQVQFNDGGSALGGDADYTWNKTTNVLTVTGDINYTGLLTDTSDRRQKTAIHDFPDDTLERVMKLKPVSFRMKKGGNGVEYGFIAQDVEPLFPELVRDREETLSLNYIGLMAPMVKAIQEMKTENDVVAAQNRQLRETLSKLVIEVKTLRRAVERGHNLH